MSIKKRIENLEQVAGSEAAKACECAGAILVIRAGDPRPECECGKHDDILIVIDR